MIFHSMKKEKISDYVGKLIRNLIDVYSEKREIDYDINRMPFLVKTFKLNYQSYVLQYFLSLIRKI